MNIGAHLNSKGIVNVYIFFRHGPHDHKISTYLSFLYSWGYFGRPKGNAFLSRGSSYSKDGSSQEFF